MNVRLVVLIMPYHHPVFDCGGIGRGGGVGRGLGVGVGLGVAVGVEVAVGVGVGPSAVVLRIVPKAPTAVPVFVSVKETLDRSWFVPLSSRVQFWPPSVVLRIVPSWPTAVPLLASVKETPERTVPGLGWLIQVSPPSVVLRMVPITKLKSPPTTVPVFASVKEQPEADHSFRLFAGSNFPRHLSFLELSPHYQQRFRYLHR
jgi:hypothetical protein